MNPKFEIVAVEFFEADDGTVGVVFSNPAMLLDILGMALAYSKSQAELSLPDTAERLGHDARTFSLEEMKTTVKEKYESLGAVFVPVPKPQLQ